MATTTKDWPGVSREVLAKDAPQLLPLQDSLPSLAIITSSSDVFTAAKSGFQVDLPPDHVPLAVVRPKATGEVSTIVRFATSSTPRVPITVRSGSHDFWGRSSAKGALVIDMRQINSVTVASDRKSATVGGGILAADLLTQLEPHNLLATTGVCPSVGFCGWSLLGGYGPLAGSYGLGVDQILDATIVDPNGKIIDKCDSETLWGLRGGGANFGVVTALNIKVHPGPKVLAGFVVFPLEEALEVLNKYRELLEEDFPDAFSGNATVGNLTGGFPGLSIVFVWSSSDLNAGKIFLEKIKKLGTAKSAVKEKNLSEFIKVAFPPTPKKSMVTSVYIPELSEGLIRIVVDNAKRAPAGSECFAHFHFSHGESTKPNAGSCFNVREPHLLIEIFGTPASKAAEDKDPGLKDKAYHWVKSLESELLDSQLTMDGGYLNLLDPSVPAKDSYGGKWNRLLSLKKKVDPENIFSNACPLLLGSN
ncbi:hypothetical protein D9758_004133 [Tetrapyrgos nigripes]|uniref:FAD-binding PCMH-type domain-containing protein n=1 Tax=Tetrapyrgos nigripes TaxID=182062 RepID=A0A8H5GTW9_9AGAR|nr:hypothetical protein D9758_004133 [Tetrapyrgos nigripes]